LQLSCDYIDKLDDVRKKGTIEEMVKLHQQIYTRSLRPTNSSIKSLQPSDKLFIIPDKNVLFCLPPKSDSSPWEALLSELFMPTNKTPADYGIQDGRHSFKPAFYKLVPKLFDGKTVDLPVMNGTTNIINVRDPFSRIYAAWADKLKEHKFRNGSLTPIGESYRVYDELVKKAAKLKGPSPPRSYKVSFEKFLKFIVSHGDEFSLNVHFRSQSAICQQCSIKYDYITHQESASSEFDWLMARTRLSNRRSLAYHAAHYNLETLSAQFAQIPVDLLHKLYRYFYIDFVSFGFSPDIASSLFTNVMFSDKNRGLKVSLKN